MMINYEIESCIYVLSKVNTGVGQRSNHVGGVHEMNVVCTKTKHTFDIKLRAAAKKLSAVFVLKRE